MIGDDRNPLWEVAKKTFVSNPEIWKLFNKYSLEVHNSGYQRYSARTVFERIRWHVQVESKDAEFKINDHWPPYFSRIFMWRYPELGPSCWVGINPKQRPWGCRIPATNDGFFELRAINTNYAVETQFFDWARRRHED